MHSFESSCPDMQWERTCTPTLSSNTNASDEIYVQQGRSHELCIGPTNFHLELALVNQLEERKSCHA